MKFPKIKKHQFALLMAEKKTGIILNKNFKRHRNDQDIEAYIIFENKNEVYKYVENIIKSDDSIEFMIYNFKDNMIDFIQ